MEKLSQVIKLLDELLQPDRFRDYCPNGLQVEGRAQVGRIVTGVTASQALIDAAIERHADVVLVHHGYFWKGEAQPVTGIKRSRLKSLLVNDISLVAYHLPLDAHAQYGNNIQLAKKLGFVVDAESEVGGPESLVMQGCLNEPCTPAELAEHIKAVLGRAPLHISPEQTKQEGRRIKTLAWCTGAAQGYIEQAVQLGVDAYVTGEVSEPTYHIAKEAGIEFFSAGHHATERYGVQALGEYIANRMAVEVEFIDIPNPV